MEAPHASGRCIATSILNDGHGRSAGRRTSPRSAVSATQARLEPVIVTGSHIPRIDAETALPVQVITREEIERTGVTTPAQLLDRLPANLYGFNDASSIEQAGNAGNGHGQPARTGRRLDPDPAQWSPAGQLCVLWGRGRHQSIPLSAVERVEILKDGASAIYGSDAIAGVINFVLRKDYTGVELTAYATMTEHGGGNTYLATGTVGFGNLVADRYNVFVTASFQKNESIGSLERDYARTGYHPDCRATS